MNTLVAPAAKSLARTLITDALAIFCAELSRLGSPLPYADEADLTIDYGSPINPHIVVSFYKGYGGLLPLADECYAYSEPAVKAAKKAMKTFMLEGGSEATKGRDTQRIGPGYDFIVDFESEKTRISVDMHAKFPVMVCTNWQTGLLDLALLTRAADGQSDRWFNHVEEYLAQLGYRRLRHDGLAAMGDVYLPAEPSMAPLLVRYHYHADDPRQPEMSLTIVHEQGQPETICVTREDMATIDNPVVCLLAHPVKRGIVSAVCAPAVLPAMVNPLD